MMSSSYQSIAINQLIHQATVQSAPIHLAAPIHLSGQLNLAGLMTDIAKQKNIIKQKNTLEAGSQDSFRLTIGIDEAGRGPLLGDVVVAAAILPSLWSGEIKGAIRDKGLDKPSLETRLLTRTPLSTLTDSKQLSEKKRDLLFPQIKEQALGFIIAEVPAAVIDQVNILQATMLGMQLSAEQLLLEILRQLMPPYNNHFNLAQLSVGLLFDGNRCPDWDYDGFAELGLARQQLTLEAWVKGDGRHTSIAAASVLAKVQRDKQMYELAIQYPDFGIEQHKGYPTKAHMAAIAQYGVLPMHRRSFGPVRQALASLNR